MVFQHVLGMLRFAILQILSWLDITNEIRFLPNEKHVYLWFLNDDTLKYFYAKANLVSLNFVKFEKGSSINCHFNCIYSFLGKSFFSILLFYLSDARLFGKFGIR